MLARIDGTPPISESIQLCTFTEEGQGVCMGDSGGPLVEKSSGCLAGIVSFGVPCGLGFPDVFTEVSYFGRWVDSTMSKM